MNPMDLKHGIDMATTTMVKDIEKRAKKVGSSAEVAGSAVWSNSDPRDRQMIAEAMQRSAMKA